MRPPVQLRQGSVVGSLSEPGSDNAPCDLQGNIPGHKNPFVFLTRHIFLHQHKCVVFMVQTLSLGGEWRDGGLYKVIPDAASVELLLIYTGAKEPGIRSKDSRIGPKLTFIEGKPLKSVHLAWSLLNKLLVHSNKVD